MSIYMYAYVWGEWAGRKRVQEVGSRAHIKRGAEGQIQKKIEAGIGQGWMWGL